MIRGKSVYFFVVWSFLLFGLFGCCFFCCLGGGPGPAQTAKKKHAPAQTAKKNTPPPLPSVFFVFAVWAGGCVYFFAVWAGAFFFLLFGRVACFFLLFGRGRVLFLLFGRGRVLFFAVWAGPGARFFFCCLGGGREFTHLPVCLARL